MSITAIGAGIIGLSPGEGWAQRAHLPALRALAEYSVIAVANSSLDSAQAAASAFDIPHAFADARSLAHDPSVGIVAVTVKVPHHRALVGNVLEVGKMVYCEWPLGNGLAEAEGMAALARSKGARTLVGLQARSSPVIRYLRDLISEGYVGEVLSTNLIGSGGLGGATISARDAYTHDRSSGASLLTIPFGHSIDALCYCLGSFRTVSARMATRRRTFTIAETGEERPMEAADQVVVEGELEGGCIVAAHYRGGSSRGTNLRWEINGTRGDLEVVGTSGHMQMTTLILRGGRDKDTEMHELAIPPRYRQTPPELTGYAVNVGEAYLQFARGNSADYPVPDFDAAVATHRLLDAIEQSARTSSPIRLT